MRKGTSRFWSPLFLGLLALLSLPLNTRASTTEGNSTTQLLVYCQRALRRQRIIRQIIQIFKVRPYRIKNERVHQKQLALRLYFFLTAPIRAGPLTA